MTVTPTYLRTIAQEFSDPTLWPDATLNFFLSFSPNFINSQSAFIWPANQVDPAVAYYTLFLMKHSQINGNIAMIGMKAGDVSATFAPPKIDPNGSLLLTNSYGIILYQMMKTLLIHPLTPYPLPFLPRFPFAGWGNP